MIRSSPHPQLGDLDMADLSAAAQVPSGTQGAEVGDWDRLEDVDLGTGFKAVLFRQKDGAEHVLAFALDKDAQASGPYPYQQAAALAQGCRSRFGDNLMLTGHSQAADIATFASAASGSPAVAFNPGGIPDHVFASFNISPENFRQAAQAGQMRQYVVPNNTIDLLKKTNPSTHWPPTYGARIELPDTGLGPLKADDITSVKPLLEESGLTYTLGSLSARHESGPDGSRAIGYDSTGGTSYGKYQISSSTMPSFLKFIEHKNPGIYQTLSAHPILPVGQNGKNGALANAWRHLASTQGEELEKLEHAFIKHTHFDKAFDHIKSNTLKTRIESSKALQDVLWSAAVQHGHYDKKGDGAANIFDKVFREGMTDEDFISAFYVRRGNYFSKSKPAERQSVRDRFKRESAQALKMLAEEKKILEQKDPQSQPKPDEKDEKHAKTVPGVNTKTAVNPAQTKKAANIVQHTDASTQQPTDPRQRQAAMAQEFRKNPAQAAQIFPELQEAYQRLEAIREKFPPSSRNRAVAIMHRDLVKRIEQGKDIPTLKQAINGVHKVMKRGIER